MIFRLRLATKLKDLGYRYERETVRIQIWKHKTHRVILRKGDSYPDDYVREVLRQCKMSEADISAFLKQEIN